MKLNDAKRQYLRYDNGKNIRIVAPVCQTCQQRLIQPIGTQFDQCGVVILPNVMFVTRGIMTFGQA
jgi:hypothetical protein